VAKHLDDLEFHVAEKKIKCVDDSGHAVDPAKPNGIKMEMFVFDVFRFSPQFSVLLVHRDEDFSPLKNAPGAKECTPDTCRQDVSFLLIFFFPLFPFVVV